MERNSRKVVTGVVVSDKMDKTILVEIERVVKHPKYKKSMIRSKRIKAHDEDNSAKVGDTVALMETRPLSKDKRHRLVKILEVAE